MTPAGDRVRFVLNHRPDPVEIPSATAGTDLLTGARVEEGQTLKLNAYGVLVVRED